MTVKIIGSGAQPAELNRAMIHGGLPYACKRSKAPKQKNILDYALEACDQAISMANLTPGDIKLIISLSISPSHLTENGSILGPRLGNPVQRELQAENAYVFDLLAADWVFAIDMAHNFCSQMGYDIALLIRGEVSHDLLGDQESGFDLCDGAGALLLAINTEQDHSGLMRYLELEHIAPASVKMAAAPHSIEALKANLVFPVQPQLPQSISVAMADLLSEASCRYGDIANIVYERWLPGYSLSSNTAYVVEPDNLDVYTAPFDIPLGLHALKTKGKHRSAYLLTFDPFWARVGGILVWL